ncbi:photosystem II stability/assembly factor-like uncharacterized protein [Filimonas zeae]|uniref:Carbohydrate-binding protein n=1 Tax=Filimonas zeae TaxID=1737353 RepID=A0A917J0Q4_9BACT|nr:carbohydrate-binding protein [Filimonas zeae]MDR6340618.1 photosystem II stability/assembly factor-like uncharacterized protein [Filimonas zeae]GGH73576.1 carbohydrate-binding protein [Filimonas zeae]
MRVRISIFFYNILLLLMAGNMPATAQSYVWRNVKTGAGGFVTGLIYHTREKGLLYARTDVGGAYRWDTTYRSWVALTDGFSNETYSGILSLATDPSDANLVYIATGLYTQPWAGKAALFASTNRGQTWQQYDLPFQLGGNEDGRQTGERLQVDPHNNRILYLGTSKDGLWKSTDYGVSWDKLKGFPVPTGKGGVGFVLPDEQSGTAGKATPVLYAGCLQTGAGLYRSNNAGKSWQLVPGQPTGLMPQRAVLCGNGNLVITFSDQPGPNDIKKGAVFQFNTHTGIWRQLPVPEGMGGYAGVAASVTGDTLLVSTLDRWAPHDEVYLSTDGGNTWKGLLEKAGYNCASFPYAASLTPHWIGAVAMNPFNSEEAWFVTGYGVFHNSSVFAVTNGPLQWDFDNEGLEELVVSDLACPPQGVPLLSTVWDLDGFRHPSPDVSPPAGTFAPKQGGSFSIDFAQQQPAYVVRAFHNSKGNYGAVSKDGGVSWQSFTAYPSGTTGAGTLAVTADAGVLVWSPAAAEMHRSVNGGNSWQVCRNVPAKLKPVCDRVNAGRVYAYDALQGVFYYSMDTAATFVRSKAVVPQLPSYQLGQAQLKATPGREGDIWCTAGPEGLHHSTDGGFRFSKNETMQEAYKIALGKQAPGADYPAVYVVGKAFGQYGFFRSTDGGQSWLRINSDNNQYLGIRAIAADANVFGRVYIGTSGRGIVYGDEYTGK